MTLKELLAIDEGTGCPGCPVCEPRGKPRGIGAASGRSVSLAIRSDPAIFYARYTDARTDPAREGGMNRTP